MASLTNIEELSGRYGDGFPSWVHGQGEMHSPMSYTQHLSGRLRNLWIDYDLNHAPDEQSEDVKKVVALLEEAAETLDDAHEEWLVDKLAQRDAAEARVRRPALDYQTIVDEAVRRAHATRSSMGDQQQSLRILDTYSDKTSETAALALVNAYHLKYDMVSLMQVLIDMIQEARHGG